MKKILSLILFFSLLQFSIDAQSIFDASIHTAIGFGNVSSPAAEGPDQIIDQDATTKFLDFNIDDGMGFDVDLLGVAKTASSIRIVTANDAPERDPTQYEILGSDDGMTYTSITVGELPCVAERFLPRSFGFVNATAYTYYRVNFSGTCGTSTILQVADVQLFETIGSLPVMECPSAITVGNSPGECGATVTFDVQATDSEDGALTPEIISGLTSGSLFPLGTSSVVFSVTDSDNNVVTCDLTITVDDTENPTVNCPNELIVSVANSGDMEVEVNYSFPFSDNCSVINPLTGFTSLGTIDGISFYLSDSTFTGPEAFADALLQGGMVAEIRSEADNTFLLNSVLRNNNGIGNVLIGLNDLIIEGLFTWQNELEPNFTNWNLNEPNNAGLGGAPENYVIMLTNGTWNDVDTTQSRRYLLELIYEPLLTQGLASGSSFPLGTTTNSFVFTDAAGNSTTCDFDITVEDAVSVENQHLENGISIAPNPTQDLITINNESGILLENAQIFDLHGKLIQSNFMEPTAKYNTLDLSNLNAGLYLIKIKGEKGVAMKRVVKL